MADRTTPRVRPGVLPDRHIEFFCTQGLLIAEGFDPGQLDGCSYEFRVGTIGYTYDYPKKKTQRYKADEHIINPFETITILTLEKVNLDTKHFLSLMSKGSLFSLGLSAVCTAADPGFRGYLGITLTNLGLRPVHLSRGTGFVKGVFHRLEAEATRHYVGQHGDATMSWPYPTHFHTEPDDFSSTAAWCWRFLPPPLHQAILRIERIRSYLRWVSIAFIVLLALNIASYFSRFFVPASVLPVLERGLYLAGAFASVAGLLVSLALLTKRDRRNE